MSNKITKPRGFVNLGNTCYFNSIMQVLFNGPLFGPLLEERTSNAENKYILEDPNSEEQVELELPECDFAVRTLVDLYKQYASNQKQSTNPQPIAPSKLMNCIRQKTGRFQRLVQEDSHELLRSLIDIIRSDEMRRQGAAINSYLGENKTTELKADCFTIIDMIFGGYFLSSVKCQKCKFKSQHLEPFYDLSLAISDPINNIHSAIANFTSNAILDGDNRFICERCSKVNGKKTYEAGVKSTTIAVPPNILTLHLKRFEANTGSSRGLCGGRKGGKKNAGGGRRKSGRHNRGGDDDDEDDGMICGRGGVNFRKINKHVEFTEFIDLSDFTSDLCYDLTKINKWPRIHRGESIWYSLFAVVCHSGNLRGGHYTAYVKCEEPNDESFSVEEFAEFIQETPYIPELTDIEKIEDYIRKYDLSRSDTTEKINGNDMNESLGYQEKPRPIPGNWYHISDSDVRKSSLANVLSSQAYIVFYRRVIVV